MLCWQALHFLQVVGQTDQQGLTRRIAALLKGQRSVVVAASHTQAIAPAIEANQWQKHHVEADRVYLSAAQGIGFWDVKSVVAQGLPWGVAMKTHLRVFGVSLDHW